MSFPDTGPQDDGSRSSEQWLAAMGEDAGFVRMQVKMCEEEGASQDDKVKHLASAVKEARRLVRDIYRYGEEIHGIESNEIDAVRT